MWNSGRGIEVWNGEKMGGPATRWGMQDAIISKIPAGRWPRWRKKELQFRCQRFNLDGSETWSSYDQRHRTQKCNGSCR
jgi:hypothetical protein